MKYGTYPSYVELTGEELTDFLPLCKKIDVLLPSCTLSQEILEGLPQKAFASSTLCIDGTYNLPGWRPSAHSLSTLQNEEVE